ncbi:DNA-binding GntR family transcriptional regulator [Bradyrhizobium sp. GM22.5]
MIPLDPLPNLIDQVYARILEAISDRTLQPGQRIRQNELADRLGVSRQPVSHALHLLHRQGLVAESGRRGFEVTQLDPARIRQLYEVRGAIDALAARLAAERAGDAAGRARLEAALAAGRGIDGKTTLAELIALDVAFHRAIYRLAGNPVIEETITPQWPHMRAARWRRCCRSSIIAAAPGPSMPTLPDIFSQEMRRRPNVRRLRTRRRRDG